MFMNRYFADPDVWRRGMRGYPIAGAIFLFLGFVVWVVAVRWPEKIPLAPGSSVRWSLFIYGLALVVYGIWASMHVACLKAYLGMDGSQVVIDGVEATFPYQEVFTDGRALLVGPHWVLLGFMNRYRGWQSLYPPEVSQQFQRVPSWQLLLLGVRRGSWFARLKLMALTLTLVAGLVFIFVMGKPLIKAR